MTHATAEDVSQGVDLVGKTALVTGATSGLGRECARVLALRGARVLVGCRDPAKGEATILGFDPESRARCQTFVADLSSMRAVAGATESLLGAGRVVDLVYMNGGVFNFPFELTEEGHERTLAANYLGHFLLVHLLLSRRGLAEDARILSTLSEAVYANPLARANLATLEAPQENRPFAYAMRGSPNSKVLLALFAVELSRRLAGTPFAGVTCNGVCPRATLTDNINQGGPVMRFAGRLAAGLMAPVTEGAAPLVWAGTASAIAGTTGTTFGHRLAPIELPARCRDPELATHAWTTSERVLGLSPWPS